CHKSPPRSGVLQLERASKGWMLNSQAFNLRFSELDKLMRPIELQRETVYAEMVAPAAERPEEGSAPPRQADVLNRRPARTDNQLEVVDPALDSARQPGDLRIFPNREVVPAFR